MQSVNTKSNVLENPTNFFETQTISGENAVGIEQLPEVWRNIQMGAEGYLMRDKEAYVQMAQLFLYKLSNGDVDLFNLRNDMQQAKEGFSFIFSKLAFETLAFYGHDFHVNRYPDFKMIREKIDKTQPDAESKFKVIHICEALFEEFGYDMPASFYHVHLAPLNREEVCEIVPLRFSEQDKLNARGWDAALHGQKVFPIQLMIQSISSQQGFFWEHGCGCNHGLSRVGKAETSFKYSLRPEMRRTWIRDYIWTCWYEYAYFPFTPVTRFLTGEIIEFS
jgi:hypothetical protein